MRIRDAIWFDMDFSPKEEAIIRTPTFQRLHRIKQLGNTHHVYPCAMHTRFDHSLGVCHLSKVLCDRAGIPQGEREEIRLAALLHDITHTPFAHTLAGQLGLLRSWETKDQYKRRFKDIQNELEVMEVETLHPDDRRQLVKLLGQPDFLSIASGDPSRVKKPYRAELVADSFCADLLDYLRRDIRLCGLKREYDERILDQAVLLRYYKKQHFGLDITVPSTLMGRMRSASAVSEYVNLLYTRYALSERVYFYRAKLAADALLGKAFRIILAEGETIGGRSPEDFLYDTSDELFVEALSNHPNPEVSYLGKRLRNRQLPGCAHELDRSRLSETQLGLIFITFRGRSNLFKWLEVETEIANKARARPADIIIHSDEPEMSLKGADALIRDEKGKVRRLNKYKEIPEAQTLERAHRALWRLCIFIGERDLQTAVKVRSIAKGVLSDLLSGAK